jgi:BRCA1 C Terminus (BRCT) domain
MYYDMRLPLFGCYVYILDNENPRVQDLAEKLESLGATLTDSPEDRLTHVVTEVLDTSRSSFLKLTNFGFFCGEARLGGCLL